MKAQSSLEFLMTYGWALFIIFAVSALYINFGLSNPETSIQTSCIFESDFECVEFVAVHNGSRLDLTIILQNTAGYDLNITGVTIGRLQGVTGAPPSFSYDEVTYFTVDSWETRTILLGERIPLHIRINNAQISNQLVRMSLDIRYRINRPGFFTRMVRGDLTVRIQRNI
ncbi:MAG: hypothetical protein ACMXYK_03025 [Candidatus Woesearchaeota archaeon]